MGGALKGISGIALPVVGGMVGGPFGAMAGQAISGGLNRAMDSGPAPELNNMNAQNAQAGSQPVASAMPASIPPPVSAANDQLLMSLLQNMRRV